MPKLFASTNKPYIGNADCGNILFLNEILEVFPDTKLVIVERPIDEVILSLDAMGEDFSERDSVYESNELIEHAKNTYDHLWVDFSRMNVESCQAIWDYCIGTPFDRQRWAMLDGLNIEIIPEKKINQLEMLH